MKTFLITFTICLLGSLTLASEFTCKTDVDAVVSADGDFDQMTFTGNLNSQGLSENVRATYRHMTERNINPDDCTYTLSITTATEGTVELFCPGERLDHEYISTSKLLCEVKP